MSGVEFVEDVIAAHGGHGRWRDIAHIDVEFSAGGLAFASRQVNPMLLRRVTGRFDAHTPAATFHDFGPRHAQGEYANGDVRLLGTNGDVLVHRPQARHRFADFRRQLHWDEGDLFYFAAYAMWNYLCFPFFLATSVLRRSRVTAWRAGGWRMEAEFANDFPTHSRHQCFYFNSSLQLARHAYRADVIGSYARAIHHCTDYVCTDGVWLARRRRVLPRLWGASCLPFPTLVRIEISDIRYGAAQASRRVMTEGAACQ